MTPVRTRIVSLAAVVALIAGAAVMFSRTPERVPSPAQAPPDPALAESPKTPAKTSTLALLGRYDLDYTMKVTGAGQSGALTLKATLQVNDIGEDTRIAVLSDVHLSATGGVASGKAAAPASYTAPWRIRYRADGGLLRAEFSAETPQQVRAALLQIASLAQLTQPASADTRSWAASETDPNGPLTARYQRRGPGAIDKTFGAKAVASSVDVYDAEGEAHFTVDAKAITTLTGQLNQHIRFVRQQIEASAQVRLVQATTLPLLSDAEALQLGAREFSGFDPNQLPKPSAEDEDRTRVAGRSYAKIVSDIAKAEDAGNWQLRKSFGFDLAALMRLDPSTVTLVLGDISRETREPVRRTLIESLANARTSRAQQGLVSIMKDQSADKATASQARGASAFIEKPTEEILEQLEKDSLSSEADVRRGAVFALAAMLGNRHKAGVKDARLGRFIERGLAELKPHGIEAMDVSTGGDGALLADPRKPRATRNAREWLQAMGATHSLDALPVLATAMRFPDHVVRAEAVLAIGGIPAPQVAELVIERALKDPTYYVRHHAVTALSGLGAPAGLDAVKTVLEKDPEPSVRAQAAATIGRWMVLDPGLKSILTAALQREKNEVVINAILDVTLPLRGYQQGDRQQLVMSGGKR